MVQFYVWNPAHKLHVLSALLRASKNIFKTVNSRLWIPRAAKRAQDLSHRPLSPLRDTKYYLDDTYDGFCIFQVENTLFKIHRFLLNRDSSVFSDMLGLLPQPDSVNAEGTCDASPIFLTDPAEKFRDLIWALYALPSELCPTTRMVKSDIHRLLNIAEMANKYGFVSFEDWAAQRIYTLAQDPLGLLHTAPPATCARILDLSQILNHENLRLLVSQKLISRILWQQIDTSAILAVAEKHNLSRLQGVSYYRQLVDAERTLTDGRVVPIFKSSTHIEKRMRFLAAHHSLLNLWDQLRHNPPIVNAGGCRSHSHCNASWRQMWLDATTSADIQHHESSADVLQKLKSTVIHLRKAASAHSALNLQCSLDAMEAVTATRERVIEGLIDYFVEF
ncbi:hypothetical protein BD779DRAFT_1500288 [Infundibulicybe gibba]|nr:hypothetical protein BD779DRAFT_1500288 [Infundibulicybe gibba]